MTEDHKHTESDKRPLNKRLLGKHVQERLTRELSLLSERLSSNRSPLLTLSGDASESLISLQPNQTTV